MYTQKEFEQFRDAYVTAMLWSTNDESDPNTGGEPLDRNYDHSDLADSAKAMIDDDCRAFLDKAYPDIAQCDEDGSVPPSGANCTAIEYAGHDFWLTRAGHGCGFWDGDWPEPQATRLDELAKAAGEQWPYVGDDGMIYL